METVQVDGFRTGKQEYEHDPHTLMLGDFLAEDIVYPVPFDFDHNRRPFPTNVWGNDAYGDCVFAGRANNLLRLERVETRNTVPLTDQQVVDEYKLRTGCQTPGDAKDRGYSVIQALREWRHGWELHFPDTKVTERTYSIAAFGELNPGDVKQLRTAIYLLHGIQMGIWLPLTALDQLQTAIKQGRPCTWDYVPDNPRNRPGTWGGHLIYSKRYDEDRIWCLTWGMEVAMTTSFTDHYADEAWGVIDSFDPWRRTHYFNVNAMIEKMQEVGVTNIE